MDWVCAVGLTTNGSARMKLADFEIQLSQIGDWIQYINKQLWIEFRDNGSMMALATVSSIAGSPLSFVPDASTHQVLVGIMNDPIELEKRFELFCNDWGYSGLGRDEKVRVIVMDSNFIPSTILIPRQQIFDQRTFGRIEFCVENPDAVPNQHRIMQAYEEYEKHDSSIHKLWLRYCIGNKNYVFPIPSNWTAAELNVFVNALPNQFRSGAFIWGNFIGTKKLWPQRAIAFVFG
jgi:hypothetical protein